MKMKRSFIEASPLKSLFGCSHYFIAFFNTLSPFDVRVSGKCLFPLLFGLRHRADISAGLGFRVAMMNFAHGFNCGGGRWVMFFFWEEGGVDCFLKHNWRKWQKHAKTFVLLFGCCFQKGQFLFKGLP